MEKLRDLILASLLASRTKNSAAHRAIIDLIEKVDPNNLEITDVVITYSYLIRIIGRFAHENNYFVIIDIKKENELPTFDYTQIDETRFPYEISILKALSSRLSYSKKFIAFLEERTIKFAADLKKDHQFLKGQKSWGELSRIDRTYFLDYFIKKMMSAFGDEYFVPVASLVEIMEHDRYLGLADFEKSEISINLSYVADDEMTRTDALDTAFHEGIHNIITQMALMHRIGKLRSHPLVVDIWLADLLKKYASHAPTTIWSIYWENPEEMLCRQLEKLFAKNIGSYGILWRKKNTNSDRPYFQKLKKPLSFQ